MHFSPERSWWSWRCAGTSAARSRGALVHLGLDPPGGGNFLANVKVDADLGARAFLSRGTATFREGRLSGDLRARQLDLAFLSGLFPNLRRTGGTLDGEVRVA